MSEATGAPAAENAGTDNTAAIASAVQAALATERTRTAGLRTIAEGTPGYTAQLNAAIESGSSVEAFALIVAEGEKAKRSARTEALSADEAALAAPKSTPAVEPTGAQTADQLADQIIASANLAQGVNTKGA
jgi:hypothetical protein